MQCTKYTVFNMKYKEGSDVLFSFLQEENLKSMIWVKLYFNHCYIFKY